MLNYFDYFPEKTQTELRTIHFIDDRRNDSIPLGSYVFTEFYCTDLECDCQRLLVKVLRFKSARDQPEDVATISYTWNEALDDAWSFLLEEDISNPFLDPFHRQADYAMDLLELWHVMVQRDEAYAERLKRHYTELRAAHADPSLPTQASPFKASSKATAQDAFMATPTQQRRARKRDLARVKRFRKSR